MLRRRIRYLTRVEWDRWNRDVFDLRPEYRRPCPRHIEKEHLRLWRQLRPDVSLDTIRICYNISGVADPQMVPEEVYQSEIQYALNRYDFTYFLSNKSFSCRWMQSSLFPQTYLHNIEGQFYSGDYELLDTPAVARVLDGIEYPVVLKPSMDSGGRGVSFPESRAALEGAMEGRRDFLVQQRMRQHPFFSKFCDRSLNSLRVCVYRSVTDGRVHFLNAAMRMGIGGPVDNLTQGGLVRFIHEDGRLNSFAVDTHGLKFDRHPLSGFDFSQTEVIPKFDELKDIARRAAQDVYLTHLVSLDFCMDETARWRVLEVNLRSQTIQFPQYAGRPFFGPFTHEVIEYCKAHPRWGLLLPPGI
jgi:hypothetical protein